MLDTIDINGLDPGFPDLNKTAYEKMDNVGELLFDIYCFPDLYNGFPSIPGEIFLNGRLKPNYSIIKKGESFFIIDRGNKGGKFIETLLPFSDKQVAFSFSYYDFPHFSEMDFDTHSGGLASESLLNTYVFDILGQRI